MHVFAMYYRAVMMVVHAYFNIWCEAKAGWQTFIKRRTAVAKINSLPFATEEELANLDDVCAICYMDMTQAKVTQCRHFFHSVCLRKWLYMQDTCPLCHAVLYKEPSQSRPKNDQNQQQNQVQAPEVNNEVNNDTSDEDDVVDHDDPPYQAPLIMEHESSSDEEDNNGSSSASTRLSSQSSTSLDEFEEEEDIIFDTLTMDEPEQFELNDEEEEDILNLMEADNVEQIPFRRDSNPPEEELIIDR